MYELCTFKHPFEGQSMNHLMSNIVRSSFVPISNSYSPNLRNLVTKLLQKDPKDRFTAAQILEIPFLQQKIVQQPPIIESPIKIEDKQEVNNQLPSPKPRQYPNVNPILNQNRPRLGINPALGNQNHVSPNPQLHSPHLPHPCTLR